MEKELKVPVLNTTAEGGTLTKGLKSEREGVKAGEIVYEAEILKVTLEMKAVEDFLLKKILVNEGETINEGMSLAIGSPFIRSGTSTSPSTSISSDS
ncbi:lipoyl domain-containing protein [Anaerococcus sp. ENR1011]|uniref:Lipoyl domain-containing protein n=1 Tax=Anaerococcus groningensis TaxID=3115616 RepID=A0ABW9N0L1_9FIRM